MTEQTKRGGKRDGAGRKTIDKPSAKLTERFVARLTDEQKATLDRLGGAVWLRRMLDQSK